MIKPRIAVDFNIRARGGSVRAGFEDIEYSRGIAVGDAVVAYDPSEDLIADAVVVDIDVEARLLFFDVDRSTMREVEVPGPATMSQLLGEIVTTKPGFTIGTRSVERVAVGAREETHAGQ